MHEKASCSFTPLQVSTVVFNILTFEGDRDGSNANE